MAILAFLNRIPLFSTSKEALAWGKRRNLNTYHIHYFQGKKGYMSGASHPHITSSGLANTTPREVISTPQDTPIRQTPQVNQTTIPSQTTTTQRTTSPGTPTTGGGY